MKAAAVVEAEGLRRSYGPLEAVRGISFTVKPGELFGCLGPNGAGKTTTIKMLCTLLAPTGGRALVCGRDVVQDPRAVRRSIGIVFQDPSLDERLTGAENLWFHAGLYGLPSARREEAVRAALEMVDLTERAEDPVRNYSGGMKRRLEIARAILHRPQVMFLDEPTIGLDPQTRRRVWEHLFYLKREVGVSLLLTTHYMEEAALCDRVAIIDQGRLVALDTPEALRRRVGGDVVTLTLAAEEQVEPVREKIHARLGVRPERRGPVELAVEVPEGEKAVVRLLSVIQGAILSFSIRKPTMDDVFLKLTGHAIREEEAGAADVMRTVVRNRRAL